MGFKFSPNRGDIHQGGNPFLSPIFIQLIASRGEIHIFLIHIPYHITCDATSPDPSRPMRVKNYMTSVRAYGTWNLWNWDNITSGFEPTAGIVPLSGMICGASILYKPQA